MGLGPFTGLRGLGLGCRVDVGFGTRLKGLGGFGVEGFRRLKGVWDQVEGFRDLGLF